MRSLTIKINRLINVAILLLGICLVLLSLLVSNLQWKTILVGVGCSLLAASISSFITLLYSTEGSSSTDIINEWKLQNLYETKAQMNEKSNSDLSNAKKCIDIIAVGMATFLNYKRHDLEKLLSQNVIVRIISCDNWELLRRREQDESVKYSPDTLGTMIQDVKDLTKWVNENKSKGNISIKYHSSYPAFSYLRIDDHIFWGPNLPMYKSQMNIAFEFNIAGKGGNYFSNYFEQLWNSTAFCHDTMEDE